MNFISKFDGVLPFTGTHPNVQTHVDTVQTKAPADAILVKDADLLFNGDFKRSGADLVIARDDRELVLSDYFKGEKRAPLASSDGAYLTGNIIDALTGHVQMAQADGSASIAKIIGHVTKLTGNATVVRNGVSIILNDGDNVHQGDVVQCGANSTLGITFIDGSVFGLGSNAKMVLNEMVYDPNGSSNSSFLSLVQGTISFVAGATAKHGDMKVDTPVATMGIRGTAVLVEIDFEVTVPNSLNLPNNLTVPNNAPPARFQVLVEPDGTTGSYVLLDRVTLAPIANVNQAGTVTTVSGQGTVSFLASAQLSPETMKLINEVFSQKFTDNSNPKSNTHFTDSPVPDNTFPVKFAGGETGTATVHVFAAKDGPGGPNNAPPKSLDHIPGPPTVTTTDAELSEQTHLTGSSLIDKVSSGVSYIDTNVGDVPTVQTTFDHFGYSDSAGHVVTSTLTAAQLSAIAAVSVPLDVVQDPHGKNLGMATWTYSVQDHALDFLAEGETLTLTYMARVDNNFAPNNEYALVPFKITITGTNDAPTIVANQTTPAGGVVEDFDVNSAGKIATGGNVTFDDVDLTDTHTASFVLKSSHSDALPGFEDGTSVGTFALTPVSEVPADADTTGSLGWTFTLDNDDPILQSLEDGQTITLVYTVTVSDGHGGTVNQDVTVTITGSNDNNHPPTIVGELTTATGDLTEDVNVNPSNQIAADGIVTFRDIDLFDTHGASFVPASSTSSEHLPGFVDNTTYIGTFALAPVSEDNTDAIDTGSVNWTFTLDDSNPILQSLAEGETITQVYTVTIFDHHPGGTATQDITITITGTNDAPTIESAVTTTGGGVTEDVAVNDSNEITTNGTIGFQDVDLIDTHSASFVNKSSTSDAHLPGFVNNATYIGTFAVDPVVSEDNTDTNNTGSVGWTFTLDDNDPVLQSLAEGETITQIYTVTVSDGHTGGTVTQDVTVTITGTNDAPTIVGAATKASGGVTEDVAVNGSNEIATNGTITFQDLDLIDTHDASFVNKSSTSDAHLPGFVDNTTYIGTFALNPVSESNTDTNNIGSVGWTFTLDDNDPVLQSLAAGETITQVYTVTVSDGHTGGTVTQDITITITGTNDRPNVTPTIVEQLTKATGAVTEDVAVNASNKITTDGTIAFQDVDLIDTHTASFVNKSSTSNVHLPGFTDNSTYIGTFALDPAVSEDNTDTNNIGSVGWTFTLDDSNPILQSLAAGETITQVYTVTVSDGHTGGTVTKDVTVIITGTNDVPTIVAGSTTASGGVTEDTNISAGNIATGGSIGFQDVDLIDTHSASFVNKSSTSDAHLPGFTDNSTYIGTFALNAVSENNADTINTGSVGWTFTLNNNDPVLQSLAAGETITQVYTVTVSDGHTGGTVTKDVTVTITGTNDVPTIVAGSTTASGGVTEDTNISAGNIATSGTIGFQDVDLIDTHTASFVFKSSDASPNLPGFVEGAGAGAANIGTFALNPVSENNADTTNTGSVGWTFTLDDNDPVLQSLAQGETITQVYTVTVSDGHTGGTVSQDVTITITGTNDTPAITSDAQTADLNEIPGAHDSTTPDTASGAITFTDVDLIDTHVVTIKGVSIGGTDAGLPDDATVRGWLSLGTFTDSTNGVTGSQAWSFSAQDHYFDYLAPGEHVTLTYALEVDDHHGGTATQNVVITIAGSAEPTPPVVDLNNNTGGFNNVVHHPTDSTTPILIAQNSTITDVDSTNLVSMTVTLTNPEDNSSGSGGVNIKETLSLTAEAAALAAKDGLTVSVSTPTIVYPVTLTITGSASLADYQAILAGVQYTDTKTGHMDTTDRVITVVVNDGALDSTVHTVTVTNSNVINGTDGADSLVSTSANDYMTGAAGADNFSFSANLGNDTIADFTPGTDTITFSSPLFGGSAAVVLAATHDDGHGGTVITVDAHNSITLLNMTQAQLAAHQSDFHFV